VKRAATTVVAIACAVLQPARATRSSHVSHCVSLEGAADIRLAPALLALADLPADGRLIAVVTADIDEDGDLDVVASDTALQLHVWINDGNGHYTPRKPQGSTPRELARPAPSVDAHSTHSELFTAGTPPTIHAGSRSIASRLESACTPVVSLRAAVSACDRASSTPRAPPQIRSAA
jgi:hypothetical protein